MSSPVVTLTDLVNKSKDKKNRLKFQSFVNAILFATLGRNMCMFTRIPADSRP